MWLQAFFYLTVKTISLRRLKFSFLMVYFNVLYTYIRLQIFRIPEKRIQDLPSRHNDNINKNKATNNHIQLRILYHLKIEHRFTRNKSTHNGMWEIRFGIKVFNFNLKKKTGTLNFNSGLTPLNTGFSYPISARGWSNLPQPWFFDPKW